MAVDELNSGSKLPGEGPLCFIINLSSEKSRYTDISAALTALNIPHERYNAINGIRHPELVKNICTNSFSLDKQRELTAGEISCTLSHIGVLKRILKGSYKSAVILEDDAVFSDDFHEVWSRHLPDLLDRYGIVKLEGIVKSWTSQDGPGVKLNDKYHAITPLRPSLGSAAYAVSMNGATRLLNSYQRNMSEPYDHLLVEYEWHRVRFAELRPLPIHQSEFLESVIVKDRVAADDLVYQSKQREQPDKLYWLYGRLRRLTMWVREYIPL